MQYNHSLHVHVMCLFGAFPKTFTPLQTLQQLFTKYITKNNKFKFIIYKFYLRNNKFL